MGEAGEIQLQIAGLPAQEGGDDHGQRAAGNGGASRPSTAAPRLPLAKRLAWWAVVLVNIVFVLAGQSVATLLGRIYYDQGGNSLWMQTVVQSCGTPLAIPLLIYFRNKRPSSISSSSSAAARPPLAKLAAIYAGLGVLLAGDNLMYSYGLLYLPMSTYAIICASQVSFNAVFSYFLNKEKSLRPLVLNSVVLLTFSAALVGVSHGSDGSGGGRHPQGEIPGGVRADAVGLGALLPDPTPDATHLRGGAPQRRAPGRAGDAVLEQHGGGGRVGGRAVRLRRVALHRRRDGGVRERGGGVRDDAGVDGRVVAALHDGAHGSRRHGVVALHQRDQHGRNAAVAGDRRDLPRRPDGRGEADRHAHSRVGAHVLRVPALPRRPYQGQEGSREI